MKHGFDNRRKTRFLEGIPRASLESEGDTLTLRCKFNFSYFDFNQTPSKNFSQLTQDKLVDLLNKLKEFTGKSLEQWKRDGRFTTYEMFPPHSKFTHPKHVPHQACWGRFRMTGTFRLVGFTIPHELHDKQHPTTNLRFDKNTFYVVFLDPDHLFWPT